MSQAGVVPGASATGGAVVCFSCGYSLEGLPRDGMCPECGLPIARSYEDDLLVHSTPEYVRKLYQGSRLILAYLILTILLTVGTIVWAIAAAGAGSFQLFSMIGTLGLAVVSAAGWWMFSEADPKLQFRDGQTARKLVRAAVIVQIVIAIINFAGTMASGVYAQGAGSIMSGNMDSLWALAAVVVGLASLVSYGVHFFASMMYLRWLAPRLPDERVFKRSKQFMWLGPLLYTVGSVACGIGPLVALVMYYNMFDMVRKDVKRVLEAQGEPV